MTNFNNIIIDRQLTDCTASGSNLLKVVMPYYPSNLDTFLCDTAKLSHSVTDLLLESVFLLVSLLPVLKEVCNLLMFDSFFLTLEPVYGCVTPQSSRLEHKTVQLKPV